MPLPYIYHFNLFSKVAAFSAVSRTRVKPYSDVSTKDFGRSSQGTTSPSCSDRSRNSLVRFDVEVLSKSKIPIIDLSRTAISLPIDKYITAPLCRGGAVPLPKPTSRNRYNRSNPLPTLPDYFLYTAIFFRSRIDF